MPQRDTSEAEGAGRTEAIFRANLAALGNADAVVAVCDGSQVDDGTAWEIGYAYGRNLQVFGLRTDTRVGHQSDERVNLMILECAGNMDMTSTGIGLGLKPRQRGQREPAVRLNTAGADEEKVRALHIHFAAQSSGSERWSLPVVAISRGRRFTFWWHREARTLLVRVGTRVSARRSGYVHDPNSEALVERLRGQRACKLPGCGVVFQRRGKQTFCSPAHATTWRTRRSRGIAGPERQRRLMQERQVAQDIARAMTEDYEQREADMKAERQRAQRRKSRKAARAAKRGAAVLTGSRAGP